MFSINTDKHFILFFDMKHYCIDVYKEIQVDQMSTVWVRTLQKTQKSCVYEHQKRETIVSQKPQKQYTST